MNRVLRSTLSVTLASVALAVALNFVMPKRGKAVVAASETTLVDEVLTEVREALPEAVAAITNVVAHVQALTGFAPAPRYDENVVLLKEPVVILHGDLREVQPLAKGTHLPLLQQDGQYLRVEHKKRMITIPRSAAVTGTYHSR